MPVQVDIGVEAEPVGERHRDEGGTQRQRGHRDREVGDTERLHRQEIRHRAPGARVGEHRADPLQPGQAAVGVDRAARHAFAQHHLDDAPFDQGQHAGGADEQDHERDADDQDRESDREPDAGHRPGEVEGAGGDRQQHVEQRAIGMRVREHAEEAAQQRLARGRRRCAQGGLHADLGVAVDVGDLVRGAVAAGDCSNHLGLGLAGIGGQFRAQVILGVVQRILGQRRIAALQRLAQAFQVGGDGGRQVVGGVHALASLSTASRESRVARQAADQSVRASRPAAVAR